MTSHLLCDLPMFLLSREDEQKRREDMKRRREGWFDKTTTLHHTHTHVSLVSSGVATAFAARGWLWVCCPSKSMLPTTKEGNRSVGPQTERLLCTHVARLQFVRRARYQPNAEKCRENGWRGHRKAYMSYRALQPHPALHRYLWFIRQSHPALHRCLWFIRQCYVQ